MGGDGPRGAGPGRGGPGAGRRRARPGWSAELTGRVRAGRGVVADAQCFDTSGRLALAPVAEWLRTPDLQAAPGRSTRCGARRCDRLARLLRSGSGAGAGRRPLRAMVDAWQRHRFFEGLARALLASAVRMLLVLDNVQWCDEETLAWLTFLLRLGR